MGVGRHPDPGAYEDMVKIARESVSGLSSRDAALVLGGTAASLYRIATP